MLAPGPGRHQRTKQPSCFGGVANLPSAYILPPEQRRNSITTVNIAKCAEREQAVEVRTMRAGSRGGRGSRTGGRKQNPEFGRPDPRAVRTVYALERALSSAAEARESAGDPILKVSISPGGELGFLGHIIRAQDSTCL